MSNLTKTEQVQAYLNHLKTSPIQVNSTVRGFLELNTEDIRVQLEALCQFNPEDSEAKLIKDKLLETFYSNKANEKIMRDKK